MSGFDPRRQNESKQGENPHFLPSLDASLPPLPERTRKSSPREIEVRFFVPDRLVEELASRHEYVSIEQHYFSDKTIKDLIKRFGVAKVVSDHDSFNTARIRRTKFSKDNTIYELEFKGPKEMAGGAPISRSEFGIAITKELFAELRPKATEGSLKKRRYLINGKIEDAKAWKNASGHLDLLRRAGPSMERVKPSFATIDIELSSERLLPALRAGKHSFKFLDQCVEIGRLDSSVRTAIANSTIALEGIEGRQEKALEELRDEAKRVRKLQEKLRGR